VKRVRTQGGLFSAKLTQQITLRGVISSCAHLHLHRFNNASIKSGLFATIVRSPKVKKLHMERGVPVRCSTSQLQLVPGREWSCPWATASPRTPRLDYSFGGAAGAEHRADLPSCPEFSLGWFSLLRACSWGITSNSCKSVSTFFKAHRLPASG